MRSSGLQCLTKRVQFYLRKTTSGNFFKVSKGVYECIVVGGKLCLSITGMKEKTGI